MPVVVTGADTDRGRLVIARLVGHGLDVRATVDDRLEVAALVAAGVKTAVSDLGDPERFGAVLEDAHTVIHLRGGDDAISTVGDVLDAAEDTTVARIVTVGPAGADADHGLRASGLDVVVLRVAAGAWSDDDVAAACVRADEVRELHGYREVAAPGELPELAG